jgi:hypothetical protein
MWSASDLRFIIDEKIDEPKDLNVRFLPLGTRPTSLPLSVLLKVRPTSYIAREFIDQLSNLTRDDSIDWAFFVVFSNQEGSLVRRKLQVSSPSDASILLDTCQMMGNRVFFAPVSHFEDFFNTYELVTHKKRAGEYLASGDKKRVRPSQLLDNRDDVQWQANAPETGLAESPE